MCTETTSVGVRFKALRTPVVRELPGGAEAGFRAVQWRYLQLALVKDRFPCGSGKPSNLEEYYCGPGKCFRLTS